MTRRTILAAIGIGCCASAGVFGTGYMLFGWQPGQVGEYALSEGVGNLLGLWPLIIGGSVLLLLIPFQFGAYLISMVTLPAPLIVATFYECVKFDTSHNLIPFEFVGWAVLSALVHLPSAISRAIYVRVAAHPTYNPLDSDNRPLPSSE